jgi:hypothetical protein
MKKLKSLKGETACLTCGCGSHDTLSMNALLGVGFGDVSVYKNEICVYSESNQDRLGRRLWTTKKIENLAAKEPDSDWRIKFYAPLYEAEYQRQGEKHWVLVKKGQGFA